MLNGTTCAHYSYTKNIILVPWDKFPVIIIWVKREEHFKDFWLTTVKIPHQKKKYFKLIYPPRKTFSMLLPKLHHLIKNSLPIWQLKIIFLKIAFLLLLVWLKTFTCVYWPCVFIFSWIVTVYLLPIFLLGEVCFFLTDL